MQETDARNAGLIPGLGRSPGRGNGNPLQHACLENSTGRGAWWATVRGAAKSWTRLSFYNQKRNGKAKKKFKLTGTGWKKQNILQVSNHMKWGRKFLQRKVHDECKMGGIKPIMSVVTVSVGRLNFIIKRQSIRFFFKKSTCKLSVKISILNKRTKILKMKGWEKIHWKDSNKEKEVRYASVK